MRSVSTMEGFLLFGQQAFDGSLAYTLPTAGDIKITW